MVTETTVPLRAVEQTNSPAIQRTRPHIHSVTGALDDVGCHIERLEALLASNTDDLNDCILEPGTLPAGMQARAYSIWMIFILAGEKLNEVREIVDAIHDRARAELRETVA